MVLNLSKYKINGSHILWNFLIKPLVKYLIFSNFRKNIRPLSQTDTLGGSGDFHCKTILLRASKEAKAKAFLSVANKISLINTPKMAMSAEGFTLISKASFKVLQKDDQKSLDLGQVQNIWAISAGVELQRSHLS